LNATNSIGSFDSYGSWTFRFQRCMSSFTSSCRRCGAALCWPFCCVFGACWGVICCRRRASPDVQHAGPGTCSDSTPHYARALDQSPVAESACCVSSPPGAAPQLGLRGRPRPLDMCGTIGIGTSSGNRTSLPGFYSTSSTPSSPAGMQVGMRSRGCPSTPTSQPSPSSAKGSPVAATSCSMLSASPGQQNPVGRNYSNFSD